MERAEEEELLRGAEDQPGEQSERLTTVSLSRGGEGRGEGWPESPSRRPTSITSATVNNVHNADNHGNAPSPSTFTVTADGQKPNGRCSRNFGCTGQVAQVEPGAIAHHVPHHHRVELCWG